MDKQILKIYREMFGKTESADVNKSVEKIIEEVFTKGTLPFVATGISDEMLEGMYTFATNLYNAGKYDQAVKIFKLITSLNSSKEKFIMGYAACLHVLKDYPNAASAYTLCSLLEPNDPLPYYHISDCLMELKLPKKAKEALEKCIELIEDDPKFTHIYARAKATLQKIEKEEKEKGEKA